MIDIKDRKIGAIVGLAVGDALGVPYESKTLLSPPDGPLEMVAGTHFHASAIGEWSDDTSMALCLGTSLWKKKGFDPLDQLARYLAWRDKGYLSSKTFSFGIGGATNLALEFFKRTKKHPGVHMDDESFLGNGSIMRLAPVPVYFTRSGYKLSDVRKFSAESSKTTHANPKCIEACKLFGQSICMALRVKEKEEVLESLKKTSALFSDPDIKEIATCSFLNKPASKLSGKGLVTSTLETALWCFFKENSFEAAVERAIRFGYDADTTGAVCGQIAGAFYGESSIPDRWKSKLVKKDMIYTLAKALAE